MISTKKNVFTKVQLSKLQFQAFCNNMSIYMQIKAMSATQGVSFKFSELFLVHTLKSQSKKTDTPQSVKLHYFS